MKRWLKKSLRKIKRFFNKHLGTLSDEIYWRAYYFFRPAQKDDILIGQNHPHREFLADIIARDYPFEKVLEVGCGEGANLVIMAQRFPKTKFCGLDISNLALKEAKKNVFAKNLKNIEFFSGRADNLKHFPDKSFDLVFTDAALIYIGPDKIEKTIKELIRVARNVIILCEQNSSFDKPIYKDKWIYNYKKLFRPINSSAKVEALKIKENFWGGGDWLEFGSVIKIYLETKNEK